MGHEMNNLGEQVRELIRERFGSVPKLARQIGIPEQTIYTALNNGVVGSSLATFMPIAAVLNLDPFMLAQGKLVFRANDEQGCSNVALYDSIPAGSSYNDLVPSESFPIPAEMSNRYPQAFLLRVPDASMDRVLPKGCYALVEPCDTVSAPGQLYVITTGEGNGLIRRVYPLENGIRLVPDSDDPTIKPRVLDYGDSDCPVAHILGRVVWFTLPFSWLEKA